MSKRRRGYPSETQVKRGVRIVHGDKQLEENSDETTCAPAARPFASKNAVCTKAAFDGVNRHHFFQGMITTVEHAHAEKSA